MSFIKTIRKIRRPQVIEGEILARLTEKKYRVSINGSVRQVKTALSRDLPPGSTVVMTQTDAGFYVVAAPPGVLSRAVRRKVIHV